MQREITGLKILAAKVPDLENELVEKKNELGEKQNVIQSLMKAELQAKLSVQDSSGDPDLENKLAQSQKDKQRLEESNSTIRAQLMTVKDQMSMMEGMKQMVEK